MEIYMQVIYWKDTLRKILYGSEDSRIVKKSKLAKSWFQINLSFSLVPPPPGDLESNDTTELVLPRDRDVISLYLLVVGYSHSKWEASDSQVTLEWWVQLSMNNCPPEKIESSNTYDSWTWGLSKQ